MLPRAEQLLRVAAVILLVIGLTGTARADDLSAVPRGRVRIIAALATRVASTSYRR